MIDKTTLVEAFKAARAAALAADPGEHADGGTCNFDTPAIRPERARLALLEAAAAEAGITVTEFRWLGGRRWFWVNVPTFGQANRRTTMAEAAGRVLKQWPELHTCMYLQAD